MTELIKQCPECGSGDVHFCQISVRPYCNECNYWAAINFGSKEEAIKSWNRKLTHITTNKTIKYVVEWNDWDTYRGSRPTSRVFDLREEAKHFFDRKAKNWKFNPMLKKVVQVKETELLEMHTD